MFAILIPGVNSVEINMEAQTVTVEAEVDKDTVLGAIQKTGKECSYIGNL